MNMQTPNVMAPPAPKSLQEMRLPMVMMRDIVLKTMFRMNVDAVSDLSKAICLPIPVTQELVDLARSQEASRIHRTLHATSGGEMVATSSPKPARRARLDALTLSEYYGVYLFSSRGLFRGRSSAQSTPANIQVFPRPAHRFDGPAFILPKGGFSNIRTGGVRRPLRS